jgi:hypothetical protein
MSEFAGYKIGLSLSRCVQDILEGTVEVDDVLVIVARTMFDFEKPEQWNPVLESYKHQFWHAFSDDEIDAVMRKLWYSGKIHQPRRFSGYAVRTRHPWINVHVEPDNEAARQAFNHYQVLLGLSGELELEKDKPIDWSDPIYQALIV